MTEPKREGDAETRPFIDAAIDQHKRAVLGADQEKVAKCMEEIKEVLDKHNCHLVPRVLLSPAGTEFYIEAHPIPKREDFSAPQPVPLAQIMQEEENARKARQVSKKGKGQSGRKKKKG